MDIDIDWDAIAKLLPKIDTRVQASRLPERDYWLLKAASAAAHRRISQNCQSLLVAQIRRHEEDWYKNIAFLAAQEGVSFEEMFVRLAGESQQED